MADKALSEADLEYIRANYFTLKELCADRSETPGEVQALIEAKALPAPTYVLNDRTGMFPADYFVLLDQAGGPEKLRQHFEERFRAAGGDPEIVESEWRDYLSGLYAACLRHVIPETMVRKETLVVSITELLDKPEPENAEWQARLRREVWELDSLERQFSPDYDRERLNGPVSRDRLINAAHQRYPELFAAEVLV